MRYTIEKQIHKATGNLSSYLLETYYCDYRHPIIQKTAREIAEKHPSPVEVAVASFYWVRDNILYRLGFWQRTASETLIEKSGTCTNKANLLVALLRANNIPAGYGMYRVRGKSYLGPVVRPQITQFIAEETVHTYVCIHLGRWHRVDPSDDIGLSESIGHINHSSITVDWDGSDDAMLHIAGDDILDDRHPIADIDQIIEKKSKNARGLKLIITNICLNILRDKGKCLNDVKEVTPFVLNVLKRDYPIYFILSQIVLFHISVKNSLRCFLKGET